MSPIITLNVSNGISKSKNDSLISRHALLLQKVFFSENYSQFSTQIYPLKMTSEQMATSFYPNSIFWMSWNCSHNLLHPHMSQVQKFPINSSRFFCIFRGKEPRYIFQDIFGSFYQIANFGMIWSTWEKKIGK